MMKKNQILAGLIAALLFGMLLPKPLSAAKTVRASVHSNGTEANSYSFAPQMSTSGSTVSFYSYATNLVSLNVGGKRRYYHSLGSGQTSLRASPAPGSVSASSQPKGQLPGSSQSINGCYIAYTSYADNLVANDSNVMADIFVYDCNSRKTTRVSVDSVGRQGNANSYGPSISDNGRYIAFFSYANNLVSGDSNGVSDVFVHNRGTGKTIRVSVATNGVQGNDNSFYPSISGNGHWVAFRSRATNLVPGDTKGQADIFVHGPVFPISMAPMTLLLSK